MILFKEGFTVRKETDVTGVRLVYAFQIIVGKEDEVRITGHRGRKYFRGI